MIRIIVLSLALTACTTSDPAKAPFAGRQDLLPIQQYPRITVTAGLQPFLVFTAPAVQGPPVEPNKPLTVTTPVRAADDGPFFIQYRYIFFDAAGLPIKPQMEFRKVDLPPRNQVFLQANALDTNAVDWRLEVIPAR